jgi:2-polyprenyl-3-methyl-5-hydroxy-6-metoxy-1,4-benzoquinol methylase
MNALVQRARTAERMDAPDLDPAVYRAVLDDLARVNRWTLAARPTLAFLSLSLRDRPAARILDVGFGHGDMLRRIAAWGRRRGIALDLVGIDLNPNSEVVARAATPAYLPIEYRTGDYADLDEPFDIILSSLVAHHMTDNELVAFLRFMEARAELGWLINDLHRHAVPHRGFPVLARMLGVHPIVREDGQTSIARAFRAPEWERLLEEAGVPADVARIVRRFPFRLCVERRR